MIICLFAGYEYYPNSLRTKVLRRHLWRRCRSSQRSSSRSRRWSTVCRRSLSRWVAGSCSLPPPPHSLHLISVTVPGQTKRSREWRYNKKFTPKALGQWRGNWARTTTTTTLLCCIVLLNPAVALTLTTGLISRTASGSGRTSPRTAWRASRRSWPPPSCGRLRATSHSRTSGPKWAIWVQCGRNTWR